MGKPIKDLTGLQFGRWTVLTRADDHVFPGGQRSSRWLCRCSCGVERAVSSDRLRRGTSQSCGCLRSEKLIKDLAGQRFGMLVAQRMVGLNRYGKAVWSCLCDCGSELSVLSNSLVSGRTTTCGCHGIVAPSYTAAHTRVYRSRGRASDYPCVDCGGEAEEWSYDSTGVREHEALRGNSLLKYSSDLDSYSPRCVPCHRKLDLGRPNLIS